MPIATSATSQRSRRQPPADTEPTQSLRGRKSAQEKQCSIKRSFDITSYWGSSSRCLRIDLKFPLPRSASTTRAVIQQQSLSIVQLHTLLSMIASVHSVGQ